MEGKKLPRWRSITGLPPETSRAYQDYAKKIAERIGCERYRLDFH